MEFHELVEKLARQNQREVAKGTTLAIDPGVTTGFALFEGLTLEDCWQFQATNLVEAASYIYELLQSNQPVAWVVYEDYRVYKDKVEQHSWNELFTPKLIGAVEMACTIESVPTAAIWAYQHKKFCSDDKLDHWGFYERTKGNPHARDAVRIGAFHLIFGKDTEHF